MCRLHFSSYWSESTIITLSSRGTLENFFVERLEALQPDSGYMRLFRAIVEDQLCQEQRNVKARAANLTERLPKLADRLDQLDSAFIFERRIEKATYDRQVARLRQEMLLVDLERHDAKLEELDLEAPSRLRKPSRAMLRGSGWRPRPTKRCDSNRFTSPKVSTLTAWDLEPA
jgi:hypothetical protein